MNFLKISLKKNSSLYKIASVVTGKDRSIYICYSSNQYLKNNATKNIVPIKYSRHFSGKKCRITGGPNGKRVFELCNEDKAQLDKIKHSEGTIYLSYFDVSTIRDDLFDKASEKKKYKNQLVIDSNEFQDLTIRFFIGKKDAQSKSGRKYKKVKRYQINEMELIVTLEDRWMGNKQ